MFHSKIQMMKDFCEKPKTIKFSIIKGASLEILNPDCVKVIFFLFDRTTSRYGGG